ncbi:cysteine desulfurase [Anaerolineales bacterium HSG6]|nr:cysteine desulfurase [Anaerolineales bacterium HSG6]MDM8532505.1 cysteine desulfurase [Anaerolineales bacterium HSG25]
MFNTKKIRQDFPILDQKTNNKPLIYLDSGASSQKPQTVIESMDTYYRQYNANVHRGIYQLSEKASAAYENARKKVARFINASTWRELIFTRNTTESINLVAYSWGLANIKPGDIIITTEMEHHANLVPWQQLAAQTGAMVKYIPITEQGYLDLAKYEAWLSPAVKLVAITQMSNVLGTIPPIKTMIKQAHAVGALVLLDGAQSVPHMPVDVQTLDCDFLAFSGHKMLGPTGIGALWSRKDILSAMPPFMTGGDMIKRVTLEGSTWNSLPWKFEAGTPAIAEAIGFGEAVEYLDGLGMANIRQHEIELTSYALEQLNQVEGLQIYGPQNPQDRGGAIAFTMGDIHPHDIAAVLDGEGIAIRAGHHCAMPLHDKLGLPATTRASFYIYNTAEDVDRLVEGLDKARELLTRD